MSALVDPRVRSALEEAGVPWCLIGAHALALHGVARYTADVDLLCMQARVLDPAFWVARGFVTGGSGPLGVRIRRGDDEDPLAGLVRFEGPPPLDLIVGRGARMREALANAVTEPVEGLPVVRAHDLLALKLEAGGPRDLGDVRDLLDAYALRGDLSLEASLAALAPTLSPWAARSLARVRALGET